MENIKSTPLYAEDRPWGSWEVLVDAPGYKVKQIRVTPGGRLSYQFHAHRAEHWFITHGKALVVLEGKEIQIEKGQYIDIPLGAKHRISNPFHENLVFIEIQTGEYFGEDDIVRIEDDYGRNS